MASNIDSSTIDATFPRAGQDNNTQGFRDNFSIIKNNLATAGTEITTLQETTAKVNSDNDFKGTTITDANAILFTQTARSIGHPVIESQNIDLSLGHYQTLKVGTESPLTLTITGWPKNGSDENSSRPAHAVAKLTVELRGLQSLAGSGDPGYTSVLTNIIWKTASSTGQGTIKKGANWPDPFTIDSTGDFEDPIIVEFWTYNEGETVFANYLGKFV